MSNTAKKFRDLHAASEIFILLCAWDAASARLFEDAGAKAIGTTSAGVAWSLGYPDGNVLPTEKLAALVSSITRTIQLPLSVDVEAGYTDDPAKIADKLKPLFEAGAVGINIEDGEGEPSLLAKKIEQARKAAESVGVNVFINARTDVFLSEIGAAENRVEETASRAVLYQSAGADGIFVPGLIEPKAIKLVAAEVKMPLNVMAWPTLPTTKELEKLGVRRLSTGQTISQVVWNHASEMAKKILETGDSRVVTTGGMAYGKLQELFTK